MNGRVALNTVPVSALFDHQILDQIPVVQTGKDNV